MRRTLIGLGFLVCLLLLGACGGGRSAQTEWGHNDFRMNRYSPTNPHPMTHAHWERASYLQYLPP